MDARRYNVNLRNNDVVSVGLSQYDAGVDLVFTIYDGAESAEFPTGTTATIMGTRPSGVGFSTVCTLTGDTVSVSTSTDMTGESGTFPVEIRFTNSGIDVGTVNFMFAIEVAPHPDGTIDADITRQQTFVERLEAVEDDKVPFPTTNKYGTAGQVLKTLGDGTTEWINRASGQGVSEDLKVALLQIAQKVAYIDEDGQDYYDALYDALYPPAALVSISAVYTQSGTITNYSTLDDLRPDLVVTAYYDNGTSAVVTTYTLSGTLTEGTSTITAAYGGKTATFTVVVTHADLPPGYTQYDYLEMYDVPTSGTAARYYTIVTDAQLSSDYTVELNIGYASDRVSNIGFESVLGTVAGASVNEVISLRSSNGEIKCNFEGTEKTSSTRISLTGSNTVKILPVGKSTTYPEHNVIDVNGNEYDTGLSITGHTYDPWMGIFGCAVAAGTVQSWTTYYRGHVIGEITIKDASDVILYHYVPAKNSNNVYGFYETVAGQFWYNETYGETNYRGGSWGE